MRLFSDCNPADEGHPWDVREDVCNSDSECLLKLDGGGMCRTDTECAMRREAWADERERERGE